MEFTIKASDGLDLYARSWEPEAKPKAVICLVHGLGEHCNRYTYVANAFNQAGYALVGFDHRGHGKSMGVRGHSPSYDILMNDLDIYLDTTKKHFPGMPLFLYGHSLGGNLVINYSLRKKTAVVGIVATGPAFRTAFEPPAIKLAIGRILYSIAPSLTMGNELDVNGLSRDENVVKAYLADPLVHNKISTRLAIDMLDAGVWALHKANEFSQPLLLMHGSADRLTSSTASQEFAANCKPGICTSRIWEDFYHEIHNEPEKEVVLKTIVNWIDERI